MQDSDEVLERIAGDVGEEIIASLSDSMVTVRISAELYDAGGTVLSHRICLKQNGDGWTGQVVWAVTARDVMEFEITKEQAAGMLAELLQAAAQRSSNSATQGYDHAATGLRHLAECDGSGRENYER